MGKRKIQRFEQITDDNNRNVTYCKRKKGLIKKAMELSLLCNQYVYLSIFDQERQKLVVLQSNDEYDGKMAYKAELSDLHKCQNFEYYTNGNYTDMKSRIKIEKKLILAPSEQVFRVEAKAPQSSSQSPNLSKDANHLQKIKEQLQT